MVKKTTPQSPPLAATQAPAEVAVELPYPQIRYAVNNNTLDPIKAKNGTVATVAFTGMGTGPITLYWAIKAFACASASVDVPFGISAPELRNASTVAIIPA